MCLLEKAVYASIQKLLNVPSNQSDGLSLLLSHLLLDGSCLLSEVKPFFGTQPAGKVGILERGPADYDWYIDYFRDRLDRYLVEQIGRRQASSDAQLGHHSFT